MQDQMEDNNEKSKYVREEDEVRKGARIKPGGSKMENAESEGMDTGSEGTGDTPGTEGTREGVEQHGEIKNTK